MKFGKYILSTAAAVLAFTGCLRDDSAECPSISGGGKQVSISMNIPGTAATVTRAVDEEYVKTLDVVVYSSADEADSTTSFVKLVQLVANDIVAEGAYLTFKIDMPIGSAETYRFVLLANMRSEVNAMNLPVVKPSKQDLLSGLKFEMSRDWNTTCLPMWGETESLCAITSTTSIPTVQMVRSVARMELKVADDISSLLVLNSVMVPYQYQSGRAAPLGINYHRGSRRVTAPSIFTTAMLSPMMQYADPSEIMYVSEYGKTALDEFCLLVNAACNGVNGWYKVLLHDGNGLPVDILRNHYYTVKIKSVTGPGYTDWQDALDGNIYIQAEVMEWNEARQSVVFEGNNYIDVSHSSLKLYAEQGWVEVTFGTNFPGAGDKSGTGNNFIPGVTWQWEGTAPAWLSASVVSGGVYAKTVRLSWNATTVANSAAIRITAGNMNYILNISQETGSWITAEPVAAKMDGMYHQMEVSSPLSWNVTATGGTGITYSKYTPVTVSSAENSQQVYFRPANDPNNTTAYYVNLTFAEQEYHYTPKISRVVLYGQLLEAANCYVATPGDVIVIEASRANLTSLGTVIENGDKVSSKLIWSDNAFSTPTSSIEWAFASGKGPGALLCIKTGSREGNASVAITTPRKTSEPASLGADVVRWSWHIWVSSVKSTILSGTGTYNKWMDRNLGAKTIGTTSDSWGLYYQFGRKDPFPYTNSYYGPSGAMSFDAANNVTPSMSTLAEIIRNPMKTDGTTDWDGSDGLSCWNGSQKSVYDPCPAGWKIPNEHDIPPLDIYSATTDNMTIPGYGTFQFCGYRDNVQLKEQGAKGYYWYTHAGILPLKSFSASQAAYFHSGASVHNVMYNVRCVKIMPPV